MSDSEVLKIYRPTLPRATTVLGTINGFVHTSVLVNSIQRTQEQYVDDIRKTIAVFPDYSWELRHTVEQAPWLEVRT